MKLCIVSGGTYHRFQSDTNHRIYAKRNGYDYVFDNGPYELPACPGRRIVGFFKLAAVEKALPHHDWVLWIDDDAFFTDFDKKLEPFIQNLDPEIFWVVCQSPKGLDGRWSYLNSGLFFLRNCPESFAFLKKVRETDPATIKAWWNGSEHGLSTTGDQDAFVYTLLTSQLLPKARLLPYDAFNNRSFHYQNRLDEHFVVHFTAKNKSAEIARFGLKFGLDDTLTPAPLLREYGIPPYLLPQLRLRLQLLSSGPLGPVIQRILRRWPNGGRSAQS